MILVTGGTGLVGAHLLVELTKQHDKVRAIHRKNSNLDAVKKVFSYYFDEIDSFYSKIEWLEADITQTPSLERAFVGVTYVYHCAALISFASKDYQKMRKINIEGTANIVNFSIVNYVKKLCFVSSIATLDKSFSNKIIDENSDFNIEKSNYGYAITKYGAEMEVWRGTQEDLDVVIVNPGIILGSGFWNNGSGKFFSKINKGLKYYTEGITGYVGVKDLVKSMLKLMNSDIKNERFVLISENKSYEEVFNHISDQFDKKKPSVKVSKLMSEIIWRISKVPSFIFGIEPILTKHSAKSIHNKYYFSNEKIKKAIGIKFEPLSETIKDVCRDFKN
ncbi:SDR family oxidoreductase [Urechidicola croceus]|uniref:NAD-dependent epimerase n=1 Tax=Urechidicola croceus TaxID=1850246 RepID=A0A1D8P8Y8_9FLAO|nr:SDR family oxidoreductase [Urechidicola croceus]AOW21032.1 NAD-dependent epimerase [Urechidicola croceus]